MVFRKAVLKYRILTIRSKLSYEAFNRKMTIIEMFLSEITKTYEEFYEKHMEYPSMLIHKFSLLMSGDLSSVFTRLIEFEIEHKRFLKKQNNDSEEHSQAL